MLLRGEDPVFTAHRDGELTTIYLEVCIYYTDVLLVFYLTNVLIGHFVFESLVAVWKKENPQSCRIDR